METRQEWEKIKELFGAALEQSPEERAMFLHAACGADTSLRLEVESLIKAHESSSNLWQHPLQFQFPDTAEGRFIGPYQLVKKLGEGGMGQVWLAQQTAPLQRQVALKLIRWGMYDDTLLHRFQAERQSLAVMDHPSIAKVFDAGATPEGQPYFVMEYVAGVPITEYCDQKRLTISDRLELFIKLCEGVQHAHQKALIHRDLKPANILVVEVDGKPVPRIIDFGLAKAVGPEIATESLHTRLGSFVGTPGYMSPEQCDPAAKDIDTRTDVYSLGVILYVLLTGSLPFDAKEWKDKPLDEILRQLREKDSPRPSTMVRALDPATSSNIAKNRQTESSTLVRQVRGELDSITLKALEKERSRRYASSSELAADVRRYLNHEPVLAVPPSVAYRARKFARLHRAALVTAASFALVLIAAAVISIRQSIRASKQAALATQQAAVAQAVNDFLRNDVLAQASATRQYRPGTTPDPDLKVRTALDRAAERIEGKFAQQPEVEAAIRRTIGMTYEDLGLYPEARRQLERALELQRRVLGTENPETLMTQNRLGWIAKLQGRYQEAETLLTQTLAAERRVLGPEHPATTDPMNNLAVLYTDEGKYPQAEALYRQTIEIRRRVLGSENHATLMSMHNLALIYTDEGQYAQSEIVLNQVMEIQRRVLGPEHPDTLLSIMALAADYEQEGKYAQAEALDNSLLEIRRRTLGLKHPDTLISMANLAVVYSDEGKYVQAKALDRQALEVQRRVLGPEHPDTLTSMNNLADDYAEEGKYAQAEALFNQVLPITKRVEGPENPDTLLFMSDFAAMYQRSGNFVLAQKYAGQALAGRRHALGPTDPNTLDSAADLALAYVSQGKFAEAEPLAREAVHADQNTRPDDWRRFRAESLLGASLAGQKKYAEAEPLLLEGYQGMLARKDRIGVPDRYHLQLARQWLVQLYKDSGKPQKAAEIARVERPSHVLVPGGGVEPPRYQVPADFESAASASSAIPALRGSA